MATENAVSGQVKLEKREEKKVPVRTQVLTTPCSAFCGGIRLRRRGSVDATQRTSVPVGKEPTRRASASSSSPILHCIPGTMKIGVANLEALQLGIDSGALLAQEERLLLFGQRFVNAVATFVVTSAMDRCFVKTVVTCWRSKDRDLVERRARN